MGLMKVFLAIGISIILSLFIGYGLHVIYEPPANDYYNNYGKCQETYNCQKQISDCQAKYSTDNQGFQNCYNVVSQSTEYKSCQELYIKCIQNSYKETNTYKYYRNVFYILLIVALFCIVVGLFLNKFEGIGSGLVGSGIFLVLYDLYRTSQYWLGLNKFLRLSALGVVLIILIYFGYKKLEKKEQEQKEQMSGFKN